MPAGALDLEHPVLKVPFECYSREFRNSQKDVEREVTAAVTQLLELDRRYGEGGESGENGGAGRGKSDLPPTRGNGAEDQSNQISSDERENELRVELMRIASSLRNLKTRLATRDANQRRYLSRCRRRLDHLKRCRSLGLSFMTDRGQDANISSSSSSLSTSSSYSSSASSSFSYDQMISSFVGGGGVEQELISYDGKWRSAASPGYRRVGRDAGRGVRASTPSPQSSSSSASGGRGRGRERSRDTLRFGHGNTLIDVARGERMVRVEGARRAKKRRKEAEAVHKVTRSFMKTRREEGDEQGGETDVGERTEAMMNGKKKKKKMTTTKKGENGCDRKTDDQNETEEEKDIVIPSSTRMEFLNRLLGEYLLSRGYFRAAALLCRPYEMGHKQQRHHDDNDDDNDVELWLLDTEVWILLLLLLLLFIFFFNMF